MRVALVSTCASPVRRHGAQSVESMIWLLGRELHRLGVDVTTFACAGSEVEGKLVETLSAACAHPGAPGDWQLCETIALARALADSDGFDVVHSHNYLWGLPLEPLCRCPMVHTLHVTPYDDQALLRRTHPAAAVTAISQFQWSVHQRLPPAAAVIPHGLDAGQFTFRGDPDDYLLYLGRFTPGKGVPAAIAAARRVGLPLILAGPESPYFRQEIAGQVDGVHVRHVGAVHGPERDRLLGGARALLFPVRDPEPFGLVLAEAMACGTPAVAVAKGAVPEIVEEGLTGACCDDPSGLPDAIARAMRLDRRAIREHALDRFSAGRMAEGYLRVYERVVAGACAGSASRGGSRP